MFQMKNVTKSTGSESLPERSKNQGMTQRLNSASVGITKFQMKQSPKIISGKFREGDKVPFSLLDIPIGKAARGTKLPEQYKRRDEADLDKLFNRTTINSKSLLKYQEEEDKNNSRKEFLKTESDTGENELISNKLSEKKGRKVSERKIHTAHSNSFRSKNITAGLSERSVNGNNENNRTGDRWMPNNFRDYERLVKTAHSQRDTSNKLPFVAVREIKQRMQESDVFFVKKSEKITENFDIVRENYQKSKGVDYQDSDIFNIKNNITSLNKTGEKFLITDRKATSYSVSSKSNSEWHPKNSYPTLLNHCSTDYHILNPGIKHISKTKGQIHQELSNFNPNFRQKSLCEFIDLTRVGVPNPNKEFMTAFKKSSNAFSRDSNLCAAYLDIHRLYKNISERPFVKKLI